MSHPTEATPLLTASPACPLNATQDVAPFRRLSILRPFRGEPPENIPFRYQSFRQNLMALGFLQFNFCLIIFCALAAIGSSITMGFVLVMPLGLGGILSFAFGYLLKPSLDAVVVEQNMRKLQRYSTICLFLMLILLVLPVQTLSLAFSFGAFSGLEKFFLIILSGFTIFLNFLPICSVWGTLTPYVNMSN